MGRCAAARQAPQGGVVEWLMAPVLKTGDPKGSVGSNPTPSVSVRAPDQSHKAGAKGLVAADPHPGHLGVARIEQRLLSIRTTTEGTRRATLDCRSSQVLPMDWVLSGAGTLRQSSGSCFRSRVSMARRLQRFHMNQHLKGRQGRRTGGVEDWRPASMPAASHQQATDALQGGVGMHLPGDPPKQHQR